MTQIFEFAPYWHISDYQLLNVFNDPVTFDDLLQFNSEPNFSPVARTKQSGYVSRRLSIYDSPVLLPRRGHRNQFYVLRPSYRSTRYCYRCYFDFVFAPSSD